MSGIALIAEDRVPLASVAETLAGRLRGRLKAVAWLRGAGPALEEIEAGRWAHQVAVVFQTRPGQFDRNTVERLLGRTPLTSWLVVLGPWCVSERRRDAGLWPAGLVVTHDEFPEALADLVASVTDGAGRRHLPKTARRDEREVSRPSATRRRRSAPRAG
ncbi:MAG: hypothetical protein AAF907_13125 [Planctomycetota bacterium]